MSERITRKDFLRIAGLAALAPGVTPLGAADRATPSRRGGRGSAAAERLHGPLIRTLDPIKRLYPAEALARTGAIRLGPAEFGVMLPLFGDGEVTWSVTAAAAGAYRLAACYASTKPGTQIEVVCGPDSIRHAAIFGQLALMSQRPVAGHDVRFENFWRA